MVVDPGLHARRDEVVVGAAADDLELVVDGAERLRLVEATPGPAWSASPPDHVPVA